MTTLKLTKPQEKALRFLVAHVSPDTRTGMTPTKMAELMWPDSPGWRRMSGCGTYQGGGCLGKNMPRLGAKLLWKLYNLQLAYKFGRYDTWHPTSLARDWVKQHPETKR